MNLAIVVRKLSGGGLGIAAWNQARMLSGLGHVVTVLREPVHDSLKSTDTIQIQDIQKVSAWRSTIWSIFLRSDVLKCRLNIDPLDIDRDKYSAAVRRFLAPKLANGNLDAVLFLDGLDTHLYWHTYRTCAAIMGIHGPKHIFTHLGLDAAPVNRWLDNVSRRKIRHMNTFYAPTRMMRDLAAGYYRMDASRIDVIPNAVDTDRFRPVENTSANLAARIVYTGRITFEKGADTLVAVIPPLLNQFPDLTFLMVGDSEPITGDETYADRIVSMAKADGNGDRVRWQAPVPYEDIHTVYQKGDIFVLPTRFESFGNVCIEAQAVGLAVVASAAGGVPEIVADGETGLLVPPSDANAFQNALTKLIQNPAYRRAMGAAARQRAQRLWSLDAVAPKLEAHVLKAVNGLRTALSPRPLHVADE